MTWIKAHHDAHEVNVWDDIGELSLVLKAKFDCSQSQRPWATDRDRERYSKDNFILDERQS